MATLSDNGDMQLCLFRIQLALLFNLNLYGVVGCSPYIQRGSTLRVKASDYKHDIESAVDCQTSNLVYCISCDRFPEQYVGATQKTLAQRFCQHRGYLRNSKLDQLTGRHFDLPGHSMANMKVTIIEKIHSNDPQMRKTRERLYIQNFNTYYKGMNRKL